MMCSAPLTVVPSQTPARDSRLIYPAPSSPKAVPRNTSLNMHTYTYLCHSSPASWVVSSPAQCLSVPGHQAHAVQVKGTMQAPRFLKEKDAQTGLALHQPCLAFLTLPASHNTGVPRAICFLRSLPTLSPNFSLSLSGDTQGIAASFKGRVAGTLY